MFSWRIPVPVLNGVCSFDEKDHFVQVNIGDEFAEGQWCTVEPILWRLISQLPACRSQAVLLNLSSLSSTNSAVVTAILRIWKEITAHDGRFVVLAPSIETRRVLRVAGLNRHLSIATNAGDALQQLGVSGIPPRNGRETRLLQWVSTVATAASVASLLALFLSLGPMHLQPSILFVPILSATIASGVGWFAAAREIGAFRNFSRLLSATGIITLITVIGQWPT